MSQALPFPVLPSKPLHANHQAGLSPDVSLFLSDVETDAWPPGAILSVAAASARVLVTRGDKGADEYAPGAAAPRHLPPVKVRRRRCRACLWCLVCCALRWTLHTNQKSFNTLTPESSPSPQITAVDTNGAGDTFATSYMVALLLGEADAGAYATWCGEDGVVLNCM